MRMLAVIVVGTFLSVSSSMSIAVDWPQFRGPDGTGASKEALPTKWGQDSNLRWKVKIPGVAWSAPIVSGDKIFVTTAVTDNQPRPGGGFGGGPGGFGGGGQRGGPGGGRGGRGPGGFSPPKPGEILPSFLSQRLELSDDQKQRLDALQKEVDEKLAGLLNEEQKSEFQDGGRGGFRPSPPGQVIPPDRQDDLNLTDDQKQKLTELQKHVDEQLTSLLTENQRERMQNMRRGPGPGGPGGGGGFGGGFGDRPPPDVTYRWEVYCIDRKTGETLWKQVALEAKPRIPTQESNTYATETPVTDGQRVYAYFGMHGVYCYDFSGKLIWKKDFGAFPMARGWGTSSSPVLDGNKLFVLCDNEEKSFLVALDTLTGDELWRVPRSEKTTYSSPFVWRNKLRTEIVVLGSPKMHSYDPASGKELWELTVGNGQSSASPVGNTEMLYAGLESGGGGRDRDNDSASTGGLFAVRAGASGDLDKQKSGSAGGGVAWNSRQNGPSPASPLLYDGFIYIVKRDGGIVTCLDATTGEQAYKKRLPEAKAFWSSPWAGGGNIYFLDDSGTTYVLKSGSEFEVLNQNKLDEMFWASTAAADGEIYLRSIDHLYCVSK